jgi:signal transduction histidine kinase
MDAQAIALYKDSVDMQTFQARDEKWKSVLALEKEARRSDEIRYASELKEHLKKDSDEKRYNIILLVSLLSLAALAMVAINRKRLEAKNELNRARTELLQLNLFKEKLYAILSTNLVNSFSSFEMLALRLSGQLKTYNQAESIQVLNDLQIQAVALTTSLSSVLYWVGNQAHLKPIHPEVLTCKTLVQQIIDRYESFLADKKLTTLVFIPDQQEVIGDKEMLMIVLDNLFSNAMRFSLDGGTITCFTGDKDGLVMIGIKDTGVGISEADCKKLFNLREGFPTDRNPKGVGLGLALAHDLVEQNGGRIYVESTLGQGSTFYFTLPGKKIK